MGEIPSLTQMHLITLPIRFPDGGTFLYRLLPAINMTVNGKNLQIIK
jgi:hypothetical protein